MSHQNSTMSHSLEMKLAELERLLKHANDSSSLDELNVFLGQLEKIVTCKRCHADYDNHPAKSTMEAQIDRVLSQANRGFCLIEKEAAKELNDETQAGRYLKKVSKSALKEAKALRIDHRSRILFVGCGARPFPVTP